MAPQEFKATTLKFPPELLERIDAAAKEAGMDRSNWIRNCCTTYLSGGAPNPHTEIDDINVIDTRAREVIRSMLQRLDRLEAAQFGEDSTADPFS